LPITRLKNSGDKKEVGIANVIEDITAPRATTKHTQKQKGAGSKPAPFLHVDLPGTVIPSEVKNPSSSRDFSALNPALRRRP
jgi:hypothetical protein